ncbi:bifunctional proline dehydrogenase/L-glutamate gamma-semialdehyde dehydrogenase [Devriesea agamarum]|uniref:bifunctional proline dehydrogenase/L-glutamate gamma-semialdehyde dehydrogenase n=1 Tax=Devriesea agamarum TaxID=472569 RepID=UPI00071DA553|nr:bifunctional proline dehydrogenase/L-glutamate gamma-semialdehyde dehydrogenase [Devriesea agamarum]
MSTTTPPPHPATPEVSPAEVENLVRTWVQQAASYPAPAQATMLADLLKDQAGLDFTVAFVDRVIRPEDPRAAARELKRLGINPPSFLPRSQRTAVSVGGKLAPHVASPVTKTAQAVMRRMVSHLVLDARDPHLARSISRLRQDGVRLNINLLGEAVLGGREAARRLHGVRELLARDDVDYVSIKVSSIVDHLSLWGAQQTVNKVVETLTPLYTDAASAASPKFINMDMEEYKDLELTLDVFETLLSKPELLRLEAGIVLQAYLPDSLSAMRRLRRFAKHRVAQGGAPIKVRLVKGANLAMERVDAAVHGFELATFASKLESDAQYKRVLFDSLKPEHLAHVRLGVAGHNLFDAAHAHLLATKRGCYNVPGGLEFEMLAGMAPGQARAVRETVGSMLLYVPVVSPKEFDVAVSYLVRRLEENASSENFMSAVFELDRSEHMFTRERERFVQALDLALTLDAPKTHRTQNRLAEQDEGAVALGTSVLPATPGHFVNTPDTDASTAVNQAWAEQVVATVPSCSIAEETADAARVDTIEAVHERIEAAHKAGAAWGHRPASERAEILREAARVLAIHRGDLLALMAHETGKTLEQGDPEVSEAIDFALFYADQAEELARDAEVDFRPRRLTLVTPPWNFPVAIPTGSALAPLAAGSAVLFKPAPQARRCGAFVAELLWKAGIPRDVLTLIDVPENEVGKALISDPRIDQIILTGAYDTAALFASWRPQLRIKAETSGKNSIIVTPQADLDLAAKDVALSAFGHAGQKCSAASLVILVGSVARSRRFAAQLADAVHSLHVGYPDDPTVQVGPVIEPASGKLLEGLTQLGDGERWLAKPRQLDDTGRLWSPGVRGGVQEGSRYHMTEYFGPILGIMHADTLEDAVRIQNGTAYGLTAGLHSLDADEIAWWIQHVEAGNLYVNRGITGAIVQRQPFGGWKRSSIGATAKAGGPNYLVNLTEPVDRDTLRSADQWLADAQHSDREAMATRFVPRDVQNLHGEINVLRYLPVPVIIRAADNADPVRVRRVLHAARMVGAPIALSVATTQQRDALAADLARHEDGSARFVRVEDAQTFAARIATCSEPRVRLIGDDGPVLYEAIARRPEVALYDAEATVSGRVELLVFMREQAVSVTNHRYGNPLPHDIDVAGPSGYSRGVPGHANSLT